jgi:uncharacterized protein YbaR (Trm112 family)
MPIEKDLLDILACPESRAPLVAFQDADGDWLVSTDAATRRRYRISEDGIPIMLIDESEVLDQEPWDEIMRACDVPQAG